MPLRLSKYIYFGITFLVLLVGVGFESNAQTKSKKDTNISPSEEITYFSSDSVTVSRIHLECHKKTKDRIILRELAIKEGDKIHRKDIEAILEQESNKIFNTRLFVTVDIFYEEFRKGELDIIISLTEQWYIYPIPLIELADRNFNVWWNQQGRDLRRLEYGIRVKHNNFRGRNENLSILLQTGFTNKYDLRYSVPYINKAQTLGLNISVGYAENTNVGYITDRDTLRFVETPERNVLSSRFYSGLSLTARSRFYDRHTFFVGYRTQSIADTVAQLNGNFFGEGKTNQRYVELEYNFFRDLRDRANYPLKGYYFLFAIQQQGLGIADNDFSLFTARSEFAKFIPLSKKFFFHSTANMKLTFAQNTPYANLRGIGHGRDVIRGFEYNVTESEQHIILKNTMRFKIFENTFRMNKMPSQFSKIPVAIYPKVYFDTGYAQLMNPFETNTLPNQWLWGAGAGIDMVFYFNTVLRAEYSFTNTGVSGVRLGWKADF
ncbi:POTRA domain-containing protein [Bernardetia sp.]|uniref:POTRA domain-containing protein n=1 Tax=Bernardetia sp. TaxID=1937974 RepID=UPI0025C42A4F|nr:POTRA domain-containing protein [Bernardetia sp.]